MSTSDPKQRPDWWRGAVIYQIYPRSFFDTNEDGVGDLPGIVAKLDYVASLGVDALWISPFFRSPMKDYGYDVADYRDVDPMFGTLADFDRVLDKAHDLGLKVLIDQVLSHSSDQHPWFVDSRSSRSADKADWYVWADPKPDGTPPNNWMSLFGGPAWEWEPRRRQYYLHNFLVEQPDFNFHNPAVTEQLLSEVEFWLQRGVDGFRLDVVNFYFHDRALRDNPPRPADTLFLGPDVYPYAYQRHVYDKTQPENLGFLRQLRALMDRYPGTATVGEIGSDDPLAVMAEYTAGNDKLNMAYTFSLLNDEFSAGYIRDVIAQLEGQRIDGWPCWSLGNHDVARVMTRWGGQVGAEDSDELAKTLMALLLSLRGSVCIYQGEELGLPEVEIPRDKLRDPFGIALWPEFKGRDGCRTGIPWTQGGPYAGFSPTTPWLDVATPESHRARSVEAQEARPESVLHAYRGFLAWRRQHEALRVGDIELLDTPEPVLGFVRSHGGKRIVAVFNLGPEAVTVSIPGGPGTPLTGHGLTPAQPGASDVALPRFGAYFGRID